MPSGPDASEIRTAGSGDESVFHLLSTTQKVPDISGIRVTRVAGGKGDVHLQAETTNGPDIRGIHMERGRGGWGSVRLPPTTPYEPRVNVIYTARGGGGAPGTYHLQRRMSRASA